MQKKFPNRFGRFTYQNVPDAVYPFGITMAQEYGYPYQMATREKALCDKLYAMPPASSLRNLEQKLIDALRKLSMRTHFNCSALLSSFQHLSAFLLSLLMWHFLTISALLPVSAFTSQSGKLEIKYTDEFHDRFLILDSKALYHIGASIKDAGKKAFEISPNADGKLLESLLSRLYPLPDPFHLPAPQTDAP